MTSLMTSPGHKIGQILKLIYLRQYLNYSVNQNETKSEMAPVTVVDEKSEIFLFADDTKVFRRIESDADILQLQNDIDNLVKWSETWLLRFHPDKCVSMTISNRRSDPPCQ